MGAVKALLHPSEWHHSSKFYNAVDYYDLEAAKEQVDVLRAWRPEASVSIRLAGCRVEWLEWGDTRNHPRASQQTADGCQVEDGGGKFLKITFADGRLMRKGRDTRGLKIFHGGKRLWKYGVDY